MTGISTATITAWKQGKYTPKQDKLQKIADYFKISLDSFLNGSDIDFEEGLKEAEANVTEFVKLYSQLDEEQQKLVQNMMQAFLSKK